ncbi:MAG: M15 family metallopeptidase [Labilithrix sp.]|nr:M15 family metallopeptidase [Labilithrix sp.]
MPSPPLDAGGPPTAFACLADHYAGRPAASGSGWALELPGGALVPYDDGRTKRGADRIASPDIEDVFALGYPIGPIVPVADPEDDPGRARVESIFRATYGAGEREVSAALVPVKLAGKTVRFHRRAAPALERVGARLDALLGADPTLGRFFRELGGTFAPRTIAGTDRTSAHAWGIAIDIDTSHADYWRNTPKGAWRNRVPQAIVDAFEAEGFVWGGRWFHYDTMHFEYRPELFDARCRAPRPGR